ncbi:hypothetical protein DFH06DRAFT_1467248 [Mycena polygramma]|nr:hypothetical protein DFH06DRAFT_1467248 [Mycena polygramma]
MPDLKAARQHHQIRTTHRFCLCNYMPSPMLLLALAALTLSTNALVHPGQQGSPNTSISASVPPMPDNALIAQTANQVDQKGGAAFDAPPDIAVPPTAVTAVDGTLTNDTVADASTSGTAKRREIKRQSEFEKVFDALPAGQHDASIEGTAYLTYTLVNNATYNIAACTDWCATVDGCVFVNLYYEFNNVLLDFVFSEKSNLKCAAYGDVHNATEKTNFGGQTSYPVISNSTQPIPLTYITQSSGWALSGGLVDPATPDGYELVFGPTGGANNAPGYMGFAFLDKYDIDACAQLCNGRGVDPNGGGCAYFNIWRAVVNGVPTTYTCSMYFLVADESTAVNTGQGPLVVTFSRGYARKSVLPDGGFEGYTQCSDFCYTASYANWIGASPAGGTLDASIFFFPPYAHTGHGSALLGSADNDDSLPGTLRPAHPLTTEKNANYVVQCFMSSAFSAEYLEERAKVDILWNGARVGGVSGYSEYAFVEAACVDFIDDCYVYKV